MNIAAVPTNYRGTMFRSRLEARYAAWFDALEVDWVYEPIELGGYIPDFVIGGTAIVEVKPALNHDELEPAIAKLLASGWMDGDAPFAITTGVHPRYAVSVFRETLTGRIGRATFTNTDWIVPYCQNDMYLGISCDDTRNDWMAGAFSAACNATQWRPWAG